MFSYTDTILSIMQRIEVYNEIFKAISKEVQEYGCNQAAHRRGRDTYMFCRNNVNRFFTEEMMFRKNLEPYYDKEATKILLEGLDTYKEGVFFWLEALSESCQVTDELKYQLGIRQKESSYLLINQALIVFIRCKKLGIAVNLAVIPNFFISISSDMHNVRHR